MPPCCPVCRSPGARVLYALPRLSVHACLECGQAYLHPLPTPALEATDLRRLVLSPPVRLALAVLFGVARWTGLRNRLFAIARPASPAGATA